MARNSQPSRIKWMLIGVVLGLVGGVAISVIAPKAWASVGSALAPFLLQ